MTGFVYAIGDNAGRVKIGWSADPCRRLVKLQSDSSTSAALLGIVAATKAQEREAHSLLAPWRLQGEWFRNEGPVTAFVAMLTKPRPRPISGIMVPRHDHVLSRYRVANGITQMQVAKAVGLSHVTISQFESGQRKLSPTVIGRIADATGISARELRPDLAAIFPIDEPAE